MKPAEDTAPETPPDPQPLVSVIIPVLNESDAMETLRSLQRAAVEVIVVDGGSQDDTVERAMAMGFKVMQAATGRASQMNAGAAAASGSILLFLHADTRLPEGFVALIQQALSQPNTVAGAFELAIAGTAAGLRWVEWGVKWRSKLLQLPYGDQAIFLKATTFWQLGGFANLPIMEDFDLVQRLRGYGNIAIAPAAVVTSGRRWQALGVFRTTLLNQIVLVSYLLQVPPDQIARWYRQGSWYRRRKRRHSKNRS